MEYTYREPTDFPHSEADNDHGNTHQIDANGSPDFDSPAYPHEYAAYASEQQQFYTQWSNQHREQYGFIGHTDHTPTQEPLLFRDDALPQITHTACHQHGSQRQQGSEPIAVDSHWAQPQQSPVYTIADDQPMPEGNANEGDGDVRYSTNFDQHDPDRFDYTWDSVFPPETTQEEEVHGYPQRFYQDDDLTDVMNPDDSMVFVGPAAVDSSLPSGVTCWYNAPWSSVNQHVHGTREWESPVEQRTDPVDTSAASGTSVNDDSGSNSFITLDPDTDSAMENNDPDWGHSSVATIGPPAQDRSYQTRDASYSRRRLTSSNWEQGARQSTIPRIEIRVPQSTPQQGYLDEEAEHNLGTTYAREENLLTTGSIRDARSAASSPTSSLASGGLQCPFCDAEFTGAHARGNRGRHERLKHKDETPRSYPCEDQACDKQFARADARLKHYRKYHPHLATGPAVARR